MRLVWILGAAAAALALASGCTDDDEGSFGTGGAGGGGGTPGGSGGARDGGAAGLGAELGGGVGPVCDPRGNAACENEMDCPLATSGQLQSTAFQCGESCGAEADVEACAVDCVSLELGSSDACSTCYAQFVGCADERCFTDCFADPSSEDCKQCLGESDCSSQLEECGGITIE